ncbi:MAG: agmatine deiminase family protein [Verrucomicrobiota bacterium]
MNASADTIAGLPRLLGYRMPAEWEPHAATWLTWPRRDGISFPGGFKAIPDIWARMVALLAPGEEVHINTYDAAQRRSIVALLKKHGLGKLLDRRIYLHPFPAYEPWCRDHGPIFVKGPKGLAVVDWIYNAWGGKYPPFELDDAVAGKVATHLGMPRFTPPLVLEGGSIDVDGAGNLLTTSACLLNPNRNPQLAQTQIEAALRDYLGVENILWLGDGIAGDDTDGHVDGIARFVAPGTVLAAVEDYPEDANYGVLQANLALLRKMRGAGGKKLKVRPLPMPGPVEWKGERMPASYANFYVGNEVVLLPVFDDPNDERAARILAECFPSRRIEPILARELINGLGAFHCVTQQQPAG